MGRTATLVREAVEKGYWGPVEGRMVVEAFRASGESASAYCRRVGLTRQRLRYWLSRVPEASAVDRLTFAECVLRPSDAVAGSRATDEHVVRVLMSGVEVQIPVGAGAAYVASLVRELAC